MPRHLSRVWFAAALLSLAISSSCRAATAQQIDKAIDDGKKYLYGCQKPDGTWEGFFEKKEAWTEGGVTAMCLYALLSTGESEKDPRLARAINFVVNFDTVGTYPLAFQALALSKLSDSPRVQKALKKVGLRLLQGAENKKSMGLYGYNSVPGEGGYFDHSNSQYGALGMWACGEAGIEVPDRYWDEVEKAWLGSREPIGGWSYTHGGGDPTMSMTAAGIATLFVCDDAMAYKNSGDCKGNINDPAIETALKWFESHLAGEHDLYTWYGIERIGIASGYKYFGAFDWFKNGADFLVKTQAADGSWFDYNTAVGSAYAVLFLYRGKAPIVMNKLRYDKDPDAATVVDGMWNERNRDAAGAAKFIGDQLESFMNWQVVTMAIDPDEFHDSPILYLAGSDALKFNAQQEAKLKKFVEDGGMLLGNADCGSEKFADSFRALCKKLFDNQYEFRTLPADHPIFTRQQFLAAKWKTKPVVEGLSNGVRELAILVPVADPSRAWHQKQFKGKRESFELMADIYLYSVDRQNIAEKGVTYIVNANPAILTTRSIKLARVQYPGNWNPEPGGFRRLAAIMHNQDKIDLKVDAVKLGSGQLAGFSVAHLTGTAAVTFDDAARDEIKKFVSAGGTLIVDAAGGSNDFAEAMQKELTIMFGANARVPIGSPIFGGMVSGDFHYRSYARQLAKTSLSGPSVRAFQIDKGSVIFSREDISAGLVGENVDGIDGYTPETSVKLMAAMIESILPKPATTQH